MVITKMAMPRRTFLRGMGVAMGLPLLDGMVPALSAMSKTAAATTLRAGFFYVPNGIIMESWLPKGGTTDFELSSTLSPLADFRKDLVVVEGLSNHEATRGTGAGAHSKCQTTWITGVACKETEGADIGAGISLDQHAASRLGADAPLRSLEICTEPSFLGAVCEQGLSCVYHNTFSWRTPTTPLPMENNPRVIFERLFGEGGTSAERLSQVQKNRSILDWVLEDMQRLQKQLGPGDRLVVNEYLEAIRDVERRIQQEEQRGASEVALGTPPVGVPESEDDHTRLLLDLVFLAYQADVTRVVSYMVRREESQATYPQIGVSEAHHNISHHAGNPDKMAMVSKINQHHVTLFRHLLEKMRTTADGDGSLLDHSVFLYGAGMGDGNLHNPHLLPVLLVGGAGGRLKGGRYLKYSENTPLMNLGLSLLDKLDLRVERIGDSTERLADL